MTPQEFLDRAEQQQLLEAKVIAALRKQVAGGAFTAEQVSKFLVEKGQLTAFQAKKLLEETPAPKLSLSLPDDDPAASDAPASNTPASNVASKRAPAGDAPSAAAKKGVGSSKTAAAKQDDDKAAARKQPAPAPAASDEGVLMLEAVDPVGVSGRGAPEPSVLGLAPDLVDGAAQPIAPAQPVQPFMPVQPMAPAQPIVPAQPVGPIASPVQDLFGAAPRQTALEQAASLEGAFNPLLGGSSPFLDAPPPGAAPAPSFRKARAGSWDSPLLMFGGAGLLVLLLAGGVLWWVLGSESAQELWKQAEAEYSGGSYSQAMIRYDKFLARFPNDPNASLARVRLNMAKLRQSVEAKDWRRGLEVAHEVLPKIENEDKFSEARPELASLLPDIAAGFASQARAAKSIDEAQARLKLAEDAMGLVSNPAYIPTSFRTVQEKRIESIEEELTIVRRDIQQDQRLRETIAAIAAAAETGDTVGAYALRRNLLREYPGLEANAALEDAVRQITGKEAALVQVRSQTARPLTNDDPPAHARRLVLHGKLGKPAPGLEGRTAAVFARGAVYGVDAGAGRVLWRRFVGFGGPATPTRLGGQLDADVLAVDARRWELLRLRAATGELVWRLPVGEPFAAPTVSPDRVLVSTRAGEVLEVQPDSGESTRRVRLPQPLSTSAAVDERRPQIYQIGEHSNLYVLSATELACREVFYLGHKAGAVAVPPVLTLGHVFVADNAGLDYSLLHVLAVNNAGLQVKRALEPIRLPGQVVTPLCVDGRRVAVLTNLGAIHLLEVNLSDETKPVRVVAQSSARVKKPLVAHGVLEEGRLWVGDEAFSRHDLQAAKGQLARPWVQDAGDVFFGPPLKLGDVVLHGRQRQGSLGHTLTAVSAEDASVFWQLELGSPFTGPPRLDGSGKQLVATAANGDLFQVEPAALASSAPPGDLPARAQVGSTAVVTRGLAFTQQLEFPAGARALLQAHDGGRLAYFTGEFKTDSLELVKVTPPLERLTAPAVSLAGGVLAPSNRGQAAWLDPAGGKPRALPFQPALAPGEAIEWRRPAVLAGAPPQFVIADNRNKLYRVALVDAPRPHLAEQAQTDAKLPLVSPLAVLADRVYTVGRDADRDVLASFALPKLTAETPHDLKGRALWGPEQVGDALFVATDQEGLVCFEAHRRRWQVSLRRPAAATPPAASTSGASTSAEATLAGAATLPAGPPLLLGGDYWVALRDGRVLRLAGASGAVVSQFDVGEPLAAEPVALGDQLLLTGAGVIFTAAMPK